MGSHTRGPAARSWRNESRVLSGWVIGIVSSSGEVVSALIWSDSGERVLDSDGQVGGGPRCRRPEEGFDLGKDLLDRIEVGTAGMAIPIASPSSESHASQIAYPKRLSTQGHGS